MNYTNRMTIKVLFFGATADVTGKREMLLETSAQSASAAVNEIVEANPALLRHKLLVAINENYIQGAETLNDGDVLAVFTAVSGG
ncbi:MAG TPA: MoaD/ThiS family protein [Pyrinomonadaceae bacterium]|nr:MoaD/ThiS family protein [Pyrinomonadaceae bacterium]